MESTNHHGVNKSSLVHKMQRVLIRQWLSANANGKHRKLSIRHPSKKRVLDVFDLWDDFIDKIRTWNKPVCEYSMSALSMLIYSQESNRANWRQIYIQYRPATYLLWIQVVDQRWRFIKSWAIERSNEATIWDYLEGRWFSIYASENQKWLRSHLRIPLLTRSLSRGGINRRREMPCSTNGEILLPK